MRNGVLNGRGEATWCQLDSQYFHTVRHSRGSTFSNALWMVSDKMATKLWKNSWDVTAINTDFSAMLHCDPVPGRCQAFFFSLQDRWQQVIWVQAGGGAVGGGEGASWQIPVPPLRPVGVVVNVSGDTQISWHVQRFSVYFETCHRLCRGEACSLSLVLSVQSDKTLSMRLICFNAQQFVFHFSCSVCAPFDCILVWVGVTETDNRASWRGGDTLQYACFI